MLEFLLRFNDYSFEFEVCSLSMTNSIIHLNLQSSAVLPSTLGRLLPIDCAFPSSSFTKSMTFVSSRLKLSLNAGIWFCAGNCLSCTASLEPWLNLHGPPFL